MACSIGLVASIVCSKVSCCGLVAGVDFQKTKQQQQQPGQEDLQQQAAQQPTGAADLVQLPVFWQCLEVTFIYEHCLLFIRREAFDQNKRCGFVITHY